MEKELYLISKRQPERSVYHIFDGKDTACRLYSTGGLRKVNYGVSVRKPSGSCCKVCLEHLSKKPNAPKSTLKKPSNALFKLTGDFTKESLIAALTTAIFDSDASAFYNISVYGGTNKKKKEGGVSYWEPKPSLTNRLQEIYYNENDTRLPWDD